MLLIAATLDLWTMKNYCWTQIEKKKGSYARKVIYLFVY